MKSVLTAALVLATAGVAEAQIAKIPIPGITPGNAFTDFATCEADLPACSETRTDCCYRTFDPGSIVVPMDRCHQALDVNKLGPVSNAASPVFCADPNSTMDGRSSDMGMFKAYGLVYRLMQAGIPIYWMSTRRSTRRRTRRAPRTATSRRTSTSGSCRRAPPRRRPRGRSRAAAPGAPIRSSC